MGKARRLWSWWRRGFYDQIQEQSDASMLQEYEDLCLDYGRESPEAQRLEPHMRAIHLRRAETGHAR